MFITTHPRLPSRGRWRHRLIALAALPALFSGFAVATTAGPASAVEIIQVPCPAQPYDVLFQNRNLWTLAKPIVVAATRTFNKSDGRIVQNDLDTPLVATFTSSESKTHTVTQTSTVQFTRTTLIGTFQTSISRTITDTKTTQIGISATVTVPPHSLMIGDYGIEAYDIVYDAKIIHRVFDRCYEDSTDPTERVFTNAPTVDEGWRFRLG